MPYTKMQSEASATGNELGLQFLRREIWLNCNPNCVPTNPSLLWGEGRTDLAVVVLRDGEIGHLVDLEAVGVGDIDFLLSSQHGERLEICGKEDDDDEGTGGESEHWESSVHAICGELRGAVVVVESGEWGASGETGEGYGGLARGLGGR